VTRPGSRSFARYLRFLALALVTTAGLVLVGWVPTARLGGREAVGAMLAGCGASLLASAIGGLPIALTSGISPGALAPTVLAAMAVRMVVALAAAVVLALSGWFTRAPLLVWTAVSYVVLLTADTWYAVGVVRRPETMEK
jgi:hypothetical protein